MPGAEKSCIISAFSLRISLGLQTMTAREDIALLPGAPNRGFARDDGAGFYVRFAGGQRFKGHFATADERAGQPHH